MRFRYRQLPVLCAAIGLAIIAPLVASGDRTDVAVLKKIASEERQPGQLHFHAPGAAGLAVGVGFGAPKEDRSVAEVGQEHALDAGAVGR